MTLPRAPSAGRVGEIMRVAIFKKGDEYLMSLLAVAAELRLEGRIKPQAWAQFCWLNPR